MVLNYDSLFVRKGALGYMFCYKTGYMSVVHIMGVGVKGRHRIPLVDRY